MDCINGPPKVWLCSIGILPCKKKDIRKIETIQRVAAKMTPSLRGSSYEDGLSGQTLNPRKETWKIRSYTRVQGFEGIGVNWQRRSSFLGHENIRGHGKEFRMSDCMKETIRNSLLHRSTENKNNFDGEVIQQGIFKLGNGRHGGGTLQYKHSSFWNGATR